jgi:hypothetical protein
MMVLESKRSTSVPAKAAISADTRERVLYAPSMHALAAQD